MRQKAGRRSYRNSCIGTYVSGDSPQVTDELFGAGGRCRVNEHLLAKLLRFNMHRRAMMLKRRKPSVAEHLMIRSVSISTNQTRRTSAVQRIAVQITRERSEVFAI